MPNIVHRAASSKGGKIRTKKGLAAMSPEKRREIQSKGGKISGNNKRNPGAKQTQDDTSRDTSVLETVLGILDEEKL